jgi:choline dehydrogenase-like flavoprotein
MLVDANALADGSALEAEVCVVGSGPAGITLARELIGAGVSVCLVESGGIRYEQEAQELSQLADGEGEIAPAPQNRRRQFGGNANLWRAGRRPWRSLVRYLPLDELDFEPRPWVPDGGWPFGRQALDPFYVRAHRAAALGPYRYDVSAIAAADAPELPLDRSRVRTSVEWFGTSRPYIRDGLDELRRATESRVLYHATAIGLEVRGGRVAGVRVRSPNGKTHTVGASQVVLSAGGIENARLLLDGTDRVPVGVGNACGLVGRFFMDHLYVRGVFVPRDRSLFERMALYDVRADGNGRVAGCKLNLTDDVMAGDGLLNAALKLDARTLRSRLAALDTYARFALKHRQLRPSYFGWSTLPRPTSRFGDFTVLLQIELAPVRENRIELAPERDALGRRRARVVWRWDDLSRRSVIMTRRHFVDAFASAGLGELRFPDEDPPAMPHREGINHHIGTTRMHDDPECGVVDSNGRVHGMDNLFVTGSSVFPTGGYANPTLTIVALAIRLADHLRSIVRPAAAAAG